MTKIIEIGSLLLLPRIDAPGCADLGACWTEREIRYIRATAAPWCGDRAPAFFSLSGPEKRRVSELSDSQCAAVARLLDSRHAGHLRTIAAHCGGLRKIAEDGRDPGKGDL